MSSSARQRLSCKIKPSLPGKSKPGECQPLQPGKAGQAGSAGESFPEKSAKQTWQNPPLTKHWLQLAGESCKPCQAKPCLQPGLSMPSFFLPPQSLIWYYYLIHMIVVTKTWQQLHKHRGGTGKLAFLKLHVEIIPWTFLKVHVDIKLPCPILLVSWLHEMWLPAVIYLFTMFTYHLLPYTWTKTAVQTQAQWIVR